jgi:ketosteroid isomerase-like protein
LGYVGPVYSEIVEQLLWVGIGIMTLELNIVHKWPTALNNGDADQLVALAHQDVEVGGPRGTTSGRQVIGEWFGRANVRLNPRRFYNRKGTVVVEELGEWLSPDTGQVIDSQDVATLFIISDGLISRIMRYADPETALKEAGLDESDKVQLDY